MGLCTCRLQLGLTTLDTVSSTFRPLVPFPSRLARFCLLLLFAGPLAATALFLTQVSLIGTIFYAGSAAPPSDTCLVLAETQCSAVSRPGGIGEVRFHPVIPRTARLALQARF